MKFARLLIVFLASVLAGIAIVACSSATPRDAAEIDRMSDLDFRSLEQDVTATVAVAIGVALDKGAITEDDQVFIASAIETIARGAFEPVDGGPISAALEDAGITDAELRAAFVLAEVLMRRSGVDFGAALSPRTSELLFSIAEAVVSVSGPAQKSEG